jgi:tripartite-type tricarboxylate transporter receptor subunit TctC
MKIKVTWLAGAFVVFIGIATAHAQSGAASYPSKVIRMVVPFPPAGPTDVFARPFMEKMASIWPNPIVAEWRPGGDTIIGTDAVAKAPADGYTILLTTFTHTTTPALHGNLPYDALKDFAGAAMVASFPTVAVVPASLPARNLAEFVALAKTQPGKLNYYIPGVGTSAHLNAEVLKKSAGIDIVAVPYKGMAPALPDLLSGRVSFGFLSPSLAAPQVRKGALRALAVAAPKRNGLLPEVPTMAEAGYPDAQVIAWFAILVPAKTPRDIVNKINRDFARALADPAVIERIEAGGVTVESPMAPEEIDALMKREVGTWAKFMKESNIQRQ